MKRSLAFSLAAAALLVGCWGACADDVLFRDDFNGNQLDTSNWGVASGTWSGNRGYSGHKPTVSDGAAHLRLDTFNPWQQGTFRGTRIYTRQDFSRGDGIEFEARVRTGAMPAGIVTAFWTWTKNPDDTTDEVDFEFLTSQIKAHPVPPDRGQPICLTTRNDWNGKANHPNDGIHLSSETPIVPGLAVSDYHTFAIRWLPDRTEWLVDGVLVRSTTEALADAPMAIHLNIWVPDSSWSQAYSSALQPASAVAQNQSYYFDVDYVSVSRISVPQPTD